LLIKFFKYKKFLLILQKILKTMLMKKIFILCIMVFAAHLIYAQNQKNLTEAISHNPNLLIENTADILPEMPAIPTKPFAANVATTKAVVKTPFSSSANIYTALVSESNCLTYNSDLGLLMHIARGGGSYGDNGDDMKLSLTSNMGSNWEYIVLSDSQKKFRYPSGAILNPRGNTSINNAFGVVACPSLLLTGSWAESTFGSVQLDSTNFHFAYEPINAGTDADQLFPRNGFTATDSGIVHVIGYTLGIDTNYRLVLNSGMLDADTVNWTRTILEPELLNMPSSGNDYASGWGTAWNQEGDIGYVYIMGVDSLDALKQTAPVVFKTTDYGANWTKLPIYDFTQETELMAHLNSWWQGTLGYTGNPRINFAQWTSGYDACVDGNGNLHIFTAVKCGFGKTNSSDSLSYIYANEPTYMFDAATTASGWEVKLIDTLMTKYVPADQSGYGTPVDAVGWDHRLQISRTVDGNKLFFVWTDTDTLLLSGTDFINLYPDIYAYAYDINTGDQTPITNFTKLTLYDADNYFMYVSDRVVENGNEYTIPIATIQRGVGPGDPGTHHLVNGISFTDSQFGTSIYENNTEYAVSKVYPNPFSTTTSLDVELRNTTNLSIDIYNIIGQNVKTISYGSLTKGKHTLQINADNMESGIYIYTIHLDNAKLSGKMIVK
jgi:hypothetical protein